MIMENMLKNEEERRLRMGSLSPVPGVGIHASPVRTQNCGRLKNLRLACAQYAYNPKLLGILFHKIRLVASPESLALLEPMAELEVIGPYARHVTFDPGRYCWSVTKEFAREVILARALYEHSEKDDMGDSVLRNDEIQALREEDLPPERRGGVSGAEFDEIFETYVRNAREVRRLHESGRFRRLWTAALRRLPRAEAFRFTTWDCKDPFDVGDPADIMCQHNHRFMSHAGYSFECNWPRAPSCEAMVQSALGALGDAKTKIRHLSWDAVPTGEFPWADNEVLDGVDFSEIHTLEFQPEMPHAYPRWSDEVEARMELRGGLAVTELLKRSAHSLKHLDLLPESSSAPAKFPLSDNDIVTLPVLEYLEVNAKLDLTNFATFVARATSLKELVLRTNLARPGCGKWREVWYVNLPPAFERNCCGQEHH